MTYIIKRDSELVYATTDLKAAVLYWKDLFDTEIIIDVDKRDRLVVKAECGRYRLSSTSFRVVT